MPTLSGGVPPAVPADARLQAEAAWFGDREDIHSDLPAASRYWNDRYVVPILREVMAAEDDVGVYVAALLDRLAGRDSARPLEIAALGCGEARVEIRVCEALLAAGVRHFRMLCIDLSAGALSRARALAHAAGVGRHMEFVPANLQGWRAERLFDAVLVTQFLHHVVDLESLFDTIAAALAPGGMFATVDMIGRNGHMLWPEALAIVDAWWKRAPPRYKYNHCLRRYEETYGNWDNSRDGCEGIRAQDVLGNLLARFRFERFVAVGNIAPTLFGRHFGYNFDLEAVEDRETVEQLMRLDHDLIDVGYLKPTLMYAVMSLDPRVETRCYRHWTPAFCVRPPDTDAPGSSPALARGERAVFEERSPLLAWVREGWSSPEPHGLWSNAPRATLDVPLDHPLEQGAVLELEALADVFPPKDVQVVKVSANDAAIGVARFTVAGAVERHLFSLPDELAGARSLRIAFDFSDTRSRFDLGDPAGDLRHIAMFLHALRIG